MTLEKRIEALEIIYSSEWIMPFKGREIISFCNNALYEQIELLKAEKQRIDDYKLIKDDLIG
jgi:hypothetical protein